MSYLSKGWRSRWASAPSGVSSLLSLLLLLCQFCSGVNIRLTRRRAHSGVSSLKTNPSMSTTGKDAPYGTPGGYMPQSPLKPCNYQRCAALTKGTYCDKHMTARHTNYNRFQRSADEKKFYSGVVWKRIRALVLRDDPWCQTPGCNELASEVDHIIPLKAGGTNERDNLQSLCSTCHSRKTAREHGGIDR